MIGSIIIAVALELLREAREKGLIYWEPNTSRGYERRADMIARIDRFLSGAPPRETATWQPTHQHLKRGTTYRKVGDVEIQVSTGEIAMTLEDGSISERGACRVLCEGDELVVYQDEDGKLWGRFPDEFEDGRFVPFPKGAG